MTLVDAWPLLPPGDRVGILVELVGKGHLRSREVRKALDMVPKVKGARELRRILALLDAGCQSPLELWGAMHVFSGPGMPEFRRQYRACRYYLDVYAEAERVGFELDGAAFHGERLQRERDIRRDAKLATQGIMVVRFSYARLMSEPEAVRREILMILKSRR